MDNFDVREKKKRKNDRTRIEPCSRDRFVELEDEVVVECVVDS